MTGCSACEEVTDGPRRAGTSCLDGDLSVAGGLAVRDGLRGDEGVAVEAAHQAPGEGEVELAALAREVLVEPPRGGVGSGIRFVVLRKGAEPAGDPLEFRVDRVVDGMEGHDAVVGRDDEDVADRRRMEAEARAGFRGHATILVREPGHPVA